MGGEVEREESMLIACQTRGKLQNLKWRSQFSDQWNSWMRQQEKDGPYIYKYSVFLHFFFFFLKKEKKNCGCMKDHTQLNQIPVCDPTVSQNSIPDRDSLSIYIEHSQSAPGKVHIMLPRRSHQQHEHARKEKPIIMNV